jgi:hypothetical protein
LLTLVILYRTEALDVPVWISILVPLP